MKEGKKGKGGKEERKGRKEERKEGRPMSITKSFKNKTKKFKIF